MNNTDCQENTVQRPGDRAWESAFQQAPTDADAGDLGATLGVEPNSTRNTEFPVSKQRWTWAGKPGALGQEGTRCHVPHGLGELPGTLDGLPWWQKQTNPYKSLLIKSQMSLSQLCPRASLHRPGLTVDTSAAPGPLLLSWLRCRCWHRGATTKSSLNF